jgi:hypothetical protein
VAAVVVDLYNPADMPWISVAVSDGKHKAVRKMPLTRGWNTLRLTMADLLAAAPNLRLDGIRSVMFSTDGYGPGRVYFLDYLRAEMASP